MITYHTSITNHHHWSRYTCNSNYFKLHPQHWTKFSFYLVNFNSTCHFKVTSRVILTVKCKKSWEKIHGMWSIYLVNVSLMICLQFIKLSWVWSLPHLICLYLEQLLNVLILIIRKSLISSSINQNIYLK